jgi:hypothetical protein
VRLSGAKAAALDEVITAYAAEKDSHLRWLTPARFAALKGEREHRDDLVQQGYISPYGLQARMWKAAWKDAYETIDKFFLALAEEAKPIVWAKEHHAKACRKSYKAHIKDCPECRVRFANAPGWPCPHWSDEMIHYARWCLKSSRRVAALVAGEVPEPEHFKIETKEMRTAAKVLGHELRSHMGTWPKVRKARSACFDANMYMVFEDEGGNQVIKLMTLSPHDRITIPLKGHTTISGTIRIVKEPGERTCEVHVSFDIHPEPTQGGQRGIDLGQSEVITDDQGKHYGKDFGSFLAKASKIDKDKGQKRGKLHATRKKALAKGDKAKARRIKHNNLGYKELDNRRKKNQAECERQVNEAFREFLQLRQPSSFCMEHLDFRGKAKSKEMSRRTIQMRNSTIKDRSYFLASAVGNRREKVNPAYSSQTCPRCGYVHYENRKGDRFVCLYCEWSGHSDWVGAYNLRNRIGDPEIRLFTPKAQVKTILLSRFSQKTGESPDWKPDAEAA